MVRSGQRIGALYGAGGVVALSTIAFAMLSTSAAATVAEVQSPAVSDAGTDAPLDDASSDAGVVHDGGREDAGTVTTTPEPPPGDAGVENERKPRATRVVIESLSFENGEIPRAQASLEKLAKQELAACASERGGVQGEGTVELNFLVRARGRAEGVFVGKVKNVPPAVVECLASTLARRPVGAPSEEPVGVTALLRVIDENGPSPRSAEKTEKPKRARSK